MNSSNSRHKAFVWIVIGCIALAVGYLSWAIPHADTNLNRIQSLPLGTPLATTPLDELKAIQGQPYLIVINRETPYIGQVKLVGLDFASPQTAQTSLLCDRVHYAAGTGICLLRDITSSDLLVQVTLFGSDFKPRHTFTIEGYPSRTRISPDGRYAAFTVFVTGHSYNDANMSTATILVDTTTGKSLANLEEFQTWKEGSQFQAPGFNFWGVTFAQDSNLFYATLRNGDTTYLVQGDASARKLTVLRENVECPSLSPDGTRIAFKKRTPQGLWHLTVLDLATMQETPLAEKESVDDQVEWLDNNHILYEQIDPAPPPWLSIMIVPADGSGKPEVFVSNAVSPVTVP